MKQVLQSLPRWRRTIRLRPRQDGLPLPEFDRITLHGWPATALTFAGGGARVTLGRRDHEDWWWFASDEVRAADGRTYTCEIDLRAGSFFGILFWRPGSANGGTGAYVERDDEPDPQMPPRPAAGWRRVPGPASKG